MLLYAAGLAIGLGAGFALRGRLNFLGDAVRLRFTAMLYGALAVQVSIAVLHQSWMTESTRFALMLVSYVALIVWLAIQAAIHPDLLRISFGLVAAGTLLNFIAIAPNRGIPVSRNALALAGAPLPTGQRFSIKHVIASKSTVFNSLGDIIPISPIKDVVSIGDLLIGLGIASVIAVGMRPLPKKADTVVPDQLAPAEKVGNSREPMSEDIKSASASSVMLSQAMSITDANLSGNVHGGVIMKLVDTAAGLAAVKHAHGRVVTVSMDEMSFLEPVFLTDVVTLRAQVNDTGRTSMEVGVRVEAENTLTGERRHVSSAYLVFVALDDDGRPRPVPRLQVESDKERSRMEDAKIRRKHRIARKEALRQRSTQHGAATAVTPTVPQTGTAPVTPSVDPLVVPPVSPARPLFPSGNDTPTQ